MRRGFALSLVLVLAACPSDDETASGTPTCGDDPGVARFTEPLRDRLEASGKQLVDCTRQTSSESADCIEAAIAAQNGFEAHWFAAAEVERVYLGGPDEDGVFGVIRYQESYPFQQPETRGWNDCPDFARKAACGSGEVDDNQDWCFTCAADLQRPLCRDEEVQP